MIYQDVCIVISMLYSAVSLRCPEIVSNVGQEIDIRLHSQV